MIDGRFELIETEDFGFTGCLTVVKDKKTGVLYLMWSDSSNNYGGITPLIGSDGKPLTG